MTNSLKLALFTYYTVLPCRKVERYSLRTKRNEIAYNFDRIILNVVLYCEANCYEKYEKLPASSIVKF